MSQVSAEQARRQLHRTLNEIHALPEQELTEEEFFQKLLQQVTTCMNSVAAAVWLTDAKGQLYPRQNINLGELAELVDAGGAGQHQRLLDFVVSQGKGLLAEPHSQLNGQGNGANPTNCLLVAVPLKDHKKSLGMLEVFQPPDKTEETKQSYLSFLQHVAKVGQDYLKDRSLRLFDDRQSLWRRVEQFTRAAHASLRCRDTAYVVANEGRQLIGCDRLSVVICRDDRCRVEAISGQDVFDARSNVVRQLNHLAATVTRFGEPLWYHGERSDLPPQIEQALDGFLDESQSKLVAVLPLRTADKPLEEGGEPESPPIGALILEQFRETNFDEALVRRGEQVRDVGARALANAMEYEGLIFAPLSRALQKVWFLRRRPWTKVAWLLVASAVLALFLVPVDFELEGRGALEPVGRRDVFAAIGGVVDKVMVKHGEVIKPGKVVLKLRNVDLEVKFAEVTGQWTTTKQRLAAVRHSLLGDAQLTQDDRNRLHAEEKQLSDSFSNLSHQRELYKSKLRQREVTSPTGGQVVTWDVHDRLINRPVERGQLLLTVADTGGPWELEVHMPEDRMGHIQHAQAELGPKLPVEFILAIEPGVTYQGTLQEVHQRAEVRDEEGNTVLLRVAIDKGQLPQLRRGATVVAKVHCGRRSLGYVWFHDVIEFIQSRILFRL